MAPKARARPRPNMTRAVRRLIRDIARREKAFAHVRADRILVVAGEARRASRATIRPLHFADSAGPVSADRKRRRPAVYFRGRRMLYVLTLRPLFFRSSTPEQRIGTVLHELFHISRRFDGTLDPERRHSALPGAAFERELSPLVRRYLARCPQALLELFATDGEVLVRQWLERPGGPVAVGTRSGVRRVYREAQMFLGPVRMITHQMRH